MQPFVVLVEFLANPSFIAQFHDLIAANAKTSLKRETGCRRFDVVVDPEESRRFVLYEIYEDEAAFDEHLASSHYRSFADAIESEIEQRSVRRLASCPEGRAMSVPGDYGAAERPDTPTSVGWVVS
ncbi:MAG TPA: putative quinol monooxygenase [Roseiarcus sp.]|jgi:quinol monooxygenase YgiN|nr:putative quinol monooxygenase [Roseiarcus sp.]